MRPQLPGMDPWPELPTFWTDVHSRPNTSIADELGPRLALRYFVGVGTRTTVVSDLDIDRIHQPDVTVQHALQQPEFGGPAGTVLDAPPVVPLMVAIPTAKEVEETYVAIQELPGRKLVAVIEVLSPANKKTTDGRREYLKKRDDFTKSRVSLLEIDLLRSGAPMPIESPPRTHKKPIPNSSVDKGTES